MDSMDSLLQITRVRPDKSDANDKKIEYRVIRRKHNREVDHYRVEIVRAEYGWTGATYSKGDDFPRHTLATVCDSSKRVLWALIAIENGAQDDDLNK